MLISYIYEEHYMKYVHGLTTKDREPLSPDEFYVITDTSKDKDSRESTEKGSIIIRQVNRDIRQNKGCKYVNVLVRADKFIILNNSTRV